MKFYSLENAGNRKEEDWLLFPEGTYNDGSLLTHEKTLDYLKCEVIENPLPVPFIIQIDGQRLDINDATFIRLIVSRRVGEVFELVAPGEIQRIPADISGELGKWEVINVLYEVDCIDYKQSIVLYHPFEPDKQLGVMKLIIDPEKTENHHLFVVKNWKVAIIISEKLLTALKEINATGLEVIQVYPDEGQYDEYLKGFLEQTERKRR